MAEIHHNLTKDYGFNKIGNLIAGRGERPFAPTKEWRTAVRPYRRMANGRSPLPKNGSTLILRPIALQPLDALSHGGQASLTLPLGASLGAE